MPLLTPELLRRPEQFHLLAGRHVDFFDTPALTPALSPRRGRIVRRWSRLRTSFHTRTLLRQIDPPAATGNSPSAKRMNMNSRGCQPTEQCPKTHPTLNGSDNTILFGPFRAVMFCRFVPWVSPTAIQVVRLRRTSVQRWTVWQHLRNHSCRACTIQFTSAKRMNMNSRGCQPTEQRPQNTFDPEGVQQA